jgi:hypothetical protein
MLALAVLSPGISALYDELMSFENYNSEIYATRVPSVLVGKDFAAAQLYFLDHDEEALVLIGMDRGEDGGICRRYHLQSGSLPDLPDDERILREDDRLLVMAYQRPSFDWATHEDLISGRALARV